MKRPDNWNLQAVQHGNISRVLARVSVMLLGIAAAAVSVSACSASSTSSEPVAAAGQQSVASVPGVTVISELVDGQRGKDLVDQGAIVIDVRTPAEFAQGHVPDALLIDVSASSFAAQISQLDPTQAYVVYCRSGNRSAVAISQMLAAGFTELYDMGPLTAWAQAGHPVVTG